MFRFGDPGGRGYGTVGASNVNIGAWWSSTALSASGVLSLPASGGRVIGTCLRLASNTNQTIALNKTLDNQSTWGVAFAVKISSASSGLPSTGSTWIIMSLLDTGTTQIDLRMTASATITITRNGTVLGTTLFPISVGVWYHFELKVLIHPSAGTAELRINGITVIGPLVGQNTRSTANSTANVLQIGWLTGPNNFSSPAQIDYDDIIVYDGQANDPQGHPDINDFIGDVGLAWSLPNGDGTTTQFTRDSGTNNYLRVADTTPDGDASYVKDTVVGHIDTYAMANLPASALTVKSMAVVTYAEKDDIGPRTFCAELRTNSANFDGLIVQAPGIGYAYFFNSWGQNPSGTPATWTVADINAIEVGQKLTL